MLFAEGTSSDGNRVLPFMTSLFAAAQAVAEGSQRAAPDAVVQTLSLVYTRLHGIPLGRADRPLVGWYGDMEMRSHAWQLLKSGPLDVRIRIGPPVPLASFADRKDLARHSEAEVREHVVRILRARGPGGAAQRSRRRRRRQGRSGRARPQASRREVGLEAPLALPAHIAGQIVP